MVKLFAPAEYWKFGDEAVQEMTNGCGPESWKSIFVPNRLLGVSIVAACMIHDFMYYLGSNEVDREEADRVFLNNMLRIVEHKSSWFLTRMIRRRLALSYYATVRDCGGVYFWADKNPDELFKEVAESKM
jgi:hypothetical protein